jgi:hypothetical protein
VEVAAADMRARPYGGLFVVCLDNLSGSAKRNASRHSDARAVCASYTDDWYGGRHTPDGSAGTLSTSIGTNLG